MLKNINYNLMETITILSRSLYRYETYKEDAQECPTCQDMWTKFEAQRKQELDMLLKEMKNHIDAGTLQLE